MFFTFASLEAPIGLFSFKMISESCARPMVIKPSRANFCNPDGTITPVRLSMARCTVSKTKKKRVYGFSFFQHIKMTLRN